MNYFIESDIGVVRSENQDKAAFFDNNHFQLAILCDGMGGHEGGNYAASITIDTFKKNFYKKFKNDESKIDKWFSETIEKTKKQMELFAKKDKKFLDMGTTIVVAIVCKENIRIYNIGDSRAYIYNGLLHQITKDHNLRNYYISKFNYSEEKAATIIGATALTYALGPKKKILIDSFSIKKDPNTKFIILTSDGIHDYISKPILEKIISSNKMNLKEKSKTLVKEAIKSKSPDNLTNIILEVY